MSKVKKLWKFLTSMQFAVILLVILAVACSASSFITQGQSYSWYARQYSERAAALIIALSLDDAFHSWWFIAVNAFLCLNLIFCNLIRLPSLIERTKNAANPEKLMKAAPDIAAEGVSAPEQVFTALKMPAPRRYTAENGAEVLWSSKNRAGLWGAWVCHLGILLLILGFSLGQATHEEYTVYGVPGQTRLIGDTGLSLTIDDFRVDLREDDTVEQYTAYITVRDLTSSVPRAESAEISVNNPADLFGMRFYQNSTGWAARVSINENGEPLQSEVVCAGDHVAVADKPELIIYFTAFYPDYYLEPGYGPTTLSGSLNNPAYLYSVYYRGEVLGMNTLMPGEVLTIDEYTVTFSEPQSYTLIQIKRDRFTPLALFGGLTTLVGLALAFYVLPASVWAVRSEEGWSVYGVGRKSGVLFREAFMIAVGKENKDA